MSLSRAEPRDAPEFPRPVDERRLTARPIAIEATRDEREALARRFALVAIKSLKASVRLERDGEAVKALGRLSAAIVQSCAISGEDLAVAIEEPLALRFVPAAHPVEEEIELDAEDLDEIPFEGNAFDLGEAVAQSLASSCCIGTGCGARASSVSWGGNASAASWRSSIAF